MSMKFRKIKIKVFSLLLVVCATLFGSISYADKNVPDVISSGSNLISDDSFLSLKSRQNSVEAAAYNSNNATVMAFGIFPVKDVSVVSASEKSVIVCGYPFGCVLDTKNILVVDMTDVRTEQGSINPAKQAGIKVGDIICSINGTEVNEISDVTSCVEGCKGEELSFVCRRNGQTLEFKVQPVYSKTEQKYKIGLWVRDSEAGIGMLSFYSPEDKVCVGLGHALKDADTGDSFVMSGGTAYNAKVLSIKRGASGNPGQIHGCIQSSSKLGEVVENSSKGIYIKADKVKGVSMPLSNKYDVKTGPAQVYLSLDGNEPQYYDVMIEQVGYDSQENKNIALRVVDNELIDITGGIVQGMSGSPIIQDGKLIGAVTHVLVDDPTKGYAIFAENMLETAQSFAEEQLKQAS